MSQPVTVCLIHGHGVDASAWDGIYADLLVEAPVLKPDFARLVHLTSVEGYADELWTRLQEAHVEQVLLVGHSMGGYVALAFAEKYPERVSGLVLYQSTAYADDEAKKEQRRQTINALKTDGGAAFIERQMPKMVAPDYPVEKTQDLINQFRDLPADALTAGLTAIAARPDRTAVLRNATFPILLVLGWDDQLIAYEKTAPLANLSDQIGLAPIDRAGHLSMIEQPADSLRILQSFICQF